MKPDRSSNITWRVVIALLSLNLALGIFNSIQIAASQKSEIASIQPVSMTSNGSTKTATFLPATPCSPGVKVVSTENQVNMSASWGDPDLNSDRVTLVEMSAAGRSPHYGVDDTHASLVVKNEFTDSEVTIIARQGDFRLGLYEGRGGYIQLAFDSEGEPRIELYSPSQKRVRTITP